MRLNSVCGLFLGVLISANISLAQSLDEKSASFNFYSWNSKSFRVNDSIMESSFDFLKASGDPSYVEAVTFYPNLEDDYIYNFKSTYQNNLNEEFIPGVSIDEPLRVVRQVYGRLRSLVRPLLAALGYGKFYYEATEFFGYCREFPQSKIEECEYPTYSSTYAFVLRSVSNPTFVKNICPVFADALIWQLEWSALQSESYDLARDDIGEAFSRVSKALDYLSNKGVWEASPEFFKGLENFKIGSRTRQLLKNRYLDMGPSLMKVAYECVQETYRQLPDKSQGVETGPADLSEKIAETFEFKRFSLPKGVSEVKNPFPDSLISNRADVIPYYYLTRQLEPAAILPISVLHELESKDEASSTPEKIEAFVGYLNLFDSVFKYRLLEEDDVKKGIFAYGSSQHFSFNGKRKICVMDRSQKYNRFKNLLIDYETGEITSKNTYSCHLNNIIIERQ